MSSWSFKKILPLILIILLQLLTLLFSYLGRSIEFHIFIVIHLLLAVGIWIKSHYDLPRKVLYILGTFIVNFVIGFILINLTIVLPGSKEHNHIMYDICLPAMQKHYSTDQLHTISDGQVDKEGFGKWWYQHLECEENVRNGKGPVWSENPPDFEPIR